jgi:hypothetical protein
MLMWHQATEQFKQGGFASPVVPNHSHTLACAHLQMVDVQQQASLGAALHITHEDHGWAHG